MNESTKKKIDDILKKKNINKFKIYKKILVILIKLQKIKLRKIKNFKKKFYKIPIYSNKLIFNEANLFLDWYIPKIINKNKKFKIKEELKKIITSLIKKIQLPNTTFVHRDFHVSNLMIKKNKISVIDSQDAVYGNIAYDLASLIDDVRLKTSKNIKDIFSLPNQTEAARKYGEKKIIAGKKILISLFLNLYFFYSFCMTSTFKFCIQKSVYTFKGNTFLCQS